MTVTYTDPTHIDHDAVEGDAFVPVYARKRRTGGGSGSGGVKAWMILAPLGVLTVGGVAAAMMLSGPSEDVAPVAEPVALTPAPIKAAPLTETSPLAVPEPVAATPAPPVAAAPVERRAAPVERRAAPARRAAAPAPAPSVTGDADDAGTAALNRTQATTPAPVVTTAPTPAPTPATPRAPAIQAQPFPGQ